MFDPSANRRQIVTPDTIAYTAVIQAYAQSESPDSAEKAVAILTELIQSHSPALKADAFIFANTINVFSNMVVKVRSPSARLNAAERAEEILWLMVHEFIAVKAVSSEKEGSVGGSERKDAEKENGFEASIIPFNACMNVWAQSNLPESAARAEEILFKILDPSMEERTQVQPNVVSFNTCMQAWAKAARTDPNAPNRAEELLNLLIQQGETLGIQPDVQSYTTVMNAYAKSNQKDKAIQTRRLLDLLLSNNDLRKRKNLISAVPFTAILNAVAHSPNMMDMIPDDGDNDENTMFGQDDYEVGDPYSLALETYTALKEDLFDLGAKPDHFAFATMLDAIRQHTDAESIERRQRVESVLYDAQSAGHVSSLVLQALFEACPSKEMLESLLEIRNPLSLQSLKALPREWIRNVPPAFRKLRKTSHNFGVDKKKRGGGKANNKNKRQPKKNQRQE